MVFLVSTAISCMREFVQRGGELCTLVIGLPLLLILPLLDLIQFYGCDQWSMAMFQFKCAHKLSLVKLANCEYISYKVWSKRFVFVIRKKQSQMRRGGTNLVWWRALWVGGGQVWSDGFVFVFVFALLLYLYLSS